MRNKWTPWHLLSYREKLERMLGNFGTITYRRPGTARRLHRLYMRALLKEAA